MINWLIDGLIDWPFDLLTDWWADCLIDWFRHYDFDLDKTLYFFTAGRYEFTNKGCDMFIEALARLNYFLKVMWIQVLPLTCKGLLKDSSMLMKITVTDSNR